MSSVETFTAGVMPVRIHSSLAGLAREVAEVVSEHLKLTLSRQGKAAAIMATGNSQIKFLEELISIGGLDWSKITLFHMDEYLGIQSGHPASFAYYMKNRVEDRVRPGAFHYLRGNASEPLDECDRYTRLLQAQPIDLCCLGIGENGHLAFNDPPVADFADTHAVKLVELDRDCKMQQVKEGHFPSLEAVPPYAYTLTIPTLLSAKKVVCLAPEKRKAIPVKNALEGPVSPDCPASILRTQSHATMFLDQDSASLLSHR